MKPLKMGYLSNVLSDLDQEAAHQADYATFGSLLVRELYDQITGLANRAWWLDEDIA